MSEQPLPGMPDRAPPPTHRGQRKAHPYRTGQRELCNQCCLLIHQMGVENAPYPRTARWRVPVSGVIVPLCESHKNEAME